MLECLHQDKENLFSSVPTFVSKTLKPGFTGTVREGLRPGITGGGLDRIVKYNNLLIKPVFEGKRKVPVNRGNRGFTLIYLIR